MAASSSMLLHLSGASADTDGLLLPCRDTGGATIGNRVLVQARSRVQGAMTTRACHGVWIRRGASTRCPKWVLKRRPRQPKSRTREKGGMRLLRAGGCGKGTEVPPLLCAWQRRMAPPLLLAWWQGKAGSLQLADLPEALTPLGFHQGIAAPLLLAQLQGPRRPLQQQRSVLLTRQ